MKDFVNILLGILVTGGFGTGTYAEVLLTKGDFFCRIEDMPHSTYYHSQTGLIACGGGSVISDTRRTDMTLGT